MHPDDSQAYLSPDMAPSRQSKKHRGAIIPYTPRKYSDKNTDEVVGPCAACAKVLVCITGVYNIFAGFFLVAVALLVFARGTNTKLFGEGFSTNNPYIVFCVGFVVLLYSLILVLAACNHTQRAFKVTLKVLCVLLTITFLIELSVIGLSLWSHSVVANSKHARAEPTFAVHLRSWSNQMANTTYFECCVAFTPPYSGVNATVVDDACLWAESMYLMKGDCAGTDVLTCACQKGATDYASVFALFLQHFLTSIAIVCLVSAAVHLSGLISICVLIRSNPTSLTMDVPSVYSEYKTWN